MRHVSLLKYFGACSFSPLRSSATSISEGLNDVIRMLSGSLEGWSFGFSLRGPWASLRRVQHDPRRRVADVFFFRR